MVDLWKTPRHGRRRPSLTRRASIGSDSLHASCERPGRTETCVPPPLKNLDPRQIARAASVSASPSGWPIACSVKLRAIMRAMAMNW